MALTDSLVSYWKFDESSGNAADSTASANTLTNNNTATFNTGKINNGAYLVRASAQNFSRADNASLSITSDLSIAGWFYYTNFTTDGNGEWIVGKWADAGNQRGYLMNTLNSGDTFRLVLSTNGSDFPLVSVAGLALSTGTWYHLAFTFLASSGAVKFYKNGSQVSTTQTISAGSIFDNTANFRVGWSDNGNADTYLNGRVDEVGIWSRELSSSEISQLYNGGAGLSYPFTSTGGNNLSALLGVG